MTTELATRKGYDLYLEEDEQGPPSDMSVFTVEGDDSVSLCAHQDEVDEYERDNDDEPALLSDELNRSTFDKLLTWLEANVEGGVHYCDHWTRQDNDAGFAIHLNQRYRAALDELGAHGEGRMTAGRLNAAAKMAALERLASLYDIKL